MASGPEFETSDAFALVNHAAQFPFDEIEGSMWKLGKACVNRGSAREMVSTYLRQTVALARRLPPDLINDVSSIAFSVWNPSKFPDDPVSKREWFEWLDEIDGTINKWVTPRPHGAAEEEVDDAEPAHPQHAPSPEQAMQALPPPRKRKLALRSSVGHAHATSNGPKRRKIVSAPEQMSSVGGKSESSDSADDEDEDSSGSQGHAEDDADHSDDSDVAVRHERGPSASHGVQILDRRPLEDQSSGDERPALWSGSLSPLDNATGAVDSVATPDFEVETQEVDGPRVAESPLNVRHAQPGAPSKHQDDDASALLDPEIDARGPNRVTESGDNGDEITSTADADGLEDPGDVDDESLQRRRGSGSETPATEQPLEDQSLSAHDSDAVSPVVAGVRGIVLARGQQVAKLAHHPVPQDEELLAGSVQPVSSGENERDRLTTPTLETAPVELERTPVKYRISDKYPPEYVDGLSARLVIQLKGRYMTYTKNKKEVKRAMTTKDAVDVTDAFFIKFVGGVLDRVRRYVEGLRSHEILPSISNRTSNPSDSELLRNTTESLSCLIELDKGKLLEGVVQIKRTVALARFARAREQLLESRSADSTEKSIREHFDNFTADKYSQYTRSANVATILEKTWGPGALLFMPIHQIHFGHEKLQPISRFAQVVKIIKQEDSEDMLTNLATFLDENIFKPVEEDRPLSSGIYMSSLGSGEAFTDMFPAARRLLG